MNLTCVRNKKLVEWNKQKESVKWEFSGEVSRTEFAEGLEATVRSWNKSLLNNSLNIHYAADTVLGAESIVIKKLDAFSSLCRAYTIGAETNSSCIIYVYALYKNI